MIKTITITIDSEVNADVISDILQDGIWDALHEVGGIAILEDGEPCGKMDIFGAKVEVKST